MDHTGVGSVQSREEWVRKGFAQTSLYGGAIVLGMILGAILTGRYLRKDRGGRKETVHEPRSGSGSGEPIWSRILTGWALSLGDALIERWIGTGRGRGLQVAKSKG